MEKKLIALALLFLAGCAPAGQWQPTPSKPFATVDILHTAGYSAIEEIKNTATSTIASTPTGVPTLEHDTSQTLSTVRLEQSAPDLNLAAHSAVLIDAQNGTILFGKNAHERMFPASTTKIMTALLALEYFIPDEMMWVGEEVNLAWTSSRLDSQKAGLFFGQELPMKDLVCGLLLPSGSDAAFVIAVNVARRESGDLLMPIDQAVTHFSDLMNARSRAIGAMETNFVNPDGYHDFNHYSTAYDLALIAQQAMQDPDFREIVASILYKPFEVTTESVKFARIWVNTNRLIDPQDPHYYASANGIKTGTTTEAGYCLVSSAMFDTEMAIAVVLNSTEENVWSDSVRLLEYAKERKLHKELPDPIGSP